MENRMRELRIAHGFSQDDLAARTGIAQHTLSIIERGLRSPAPKTVRTLAEFYGVDRPYLMGLDVPVLANGDGEVIET